MSRKYDILTPLDLCVDFIVDCGHVVPKFNQTEQLIDKYELQLGGSNCIFASQASKMGLKVAGVGSVGDDYFGRFILNELQNNKVDISLIKVDKTIKTGVGIILNRYNDRAILTYSGSIDEVDKSQFTDDLIRQIKHIHIGSYFLFRKLQPHLKEIISRCKSHGATVSLDTNWDPENIWNGGLSEILPLTDIILPNENEAILISGKHTLDEAIEWLKDRIKIVVVKMGEKGAICCKGNYRKSLSALNVPVADTIGAGDSFDAGFLFGYLHDIPLEKCLQLAVICGSLSIRKTGGTGGQGFYEEIMSYVDHFSI